LRAHVGPGTVCWSAESYTSLTRNRPQNTDRHVRPGLPCVRTGSDNRHPSTPPSDQQLLAASATTLHQFEPGAQPERGSQLAAVSRPSPASHVGRVGDTQGGTRPRGSFFRRRQRVPYRSAARQAQLGQPHTRRGHRGVVAVRTTSDPLSAVPLQWPLPASRRERGLLACPFLSTRRFGLVSQSRTSRSPESPRRSARNPSKLPAAFSAQPLRFARIGPRRGGRSSQRAQSFPVSRLGLSVLRSRRSARRVRQHAGGAELGVLRVDSLCSWPAPPECGTHLAAERCTCWRSPAGVCLGWCAQWPSGMSLVDGVRLSFCCHVVACSAMGSRSRVSRLRIFSLAPMNASSQRGWLTARSASHHHPDPGDRPPGPSLARGQ